MPKTKTIIIFSIIFLSVSFSAKTCQASNYYVSPTGSASWSSCTNINTPCSLATAFANARAGDTVYMRDGIYPDVVTTGQTNSGTASDKITLQEYPGETVTFTGAAAIQINKNYWILKGINFLTIDNGYGPTFTLADASYVEIRNCLFDQNYVGHYGGAMKISGGGHNIVDECIFKRTAAPSSPDGSQVALAIGYGVKASSYNTISNCTFVDNSSYHLVIWNGVDSLGSNYNKIINNTFDSATNNAYGVGIYLSTHNLVDGNTFIGFGTVSGSTNTTKPAISLRGSNNSIRRNIFRNFGKTLGGNGVHFEQSGISENLIYNNVFYDIGYLGVALAVSPGNGHVIKNNIFWNCFTKSYDSATWGFAEGSGIGKLGGGVMIDYNFLLWQTDYTHDIYIESGPTTYTVSELNTAYGVTHNIPISSSSGPGLVDPDVTHNFQLAQGSPCIDAGVVVNDPDWGNLSYSGLAPDIGAFEYTSSGDTTPPAAPTGVTVN